MRISTIHGYGTLTIDHAASHYGAPIVVLEDGTVCGPVEAGPVLAGTLGDEDVAEVQLVEAARAAGYAVYC